MPTSSPWEGFPLNPWQMLGVGIGGGVFVLIVMVVSCLLIRRCCRTVAKAKRIIAKAKLDEERRLREERDKQLYDGEKRGEEQHGQPNQALASSPPVVPLQVAAPAYQHKQEDKPQPDQVDSMRLRAWTHRSEDSGALAEPQVWNPQHYAVVPELPARRSTSIELQSVYENPEPAPKYENTLA